MTMPCIVTTKKPDTDEWPVLPSKVAEWQETFPAVDVMAELYRARQWLRDNPARKKTYTGMSRFLGTWLAKRQDEYRPPNRGQPSGRQPPNKMAGAAEFLARTSETQRLLGGGDAE